MIKVPTDRTTKKVKMICPRIPPIPPFVELTIQILGYDLSEGVLRVLAIHLLDNIAFLWSVQSAG